MSISLYKNNVNGWHFETSGKMEKINPVPDGWDCIVGGYPSLTHYSRIRYRIPESLKTVWNGNIYMKLIFMLPNTFYSSQKSYLRFMNTDNYKTTLDGSVVGAVDSRELRFGLCIYKDQLLRVRGEHEGVSVKELWKAPAKISTGVWHTAEILGNLSSMSIGWIKFNGSEVGRWNTRVSPSTVPEMERIATRVGCGVDGAADQDYSKMTVRVKFFESFMI